MAALVLILANLLRSIFGRAIHEVVEGGLIFSMTCFISSCAWCIEQRLCAWLSAFGGPKIYEQGAVRTHALIRGFGVC